MPAKRCLGSTTQKSALELVHLQVEGGPSGTHRNPSCRQGVNLYMTSCKLPCCAGPVANMIWKCSTLCYGRLSFDITSSHCESLPYSKGRSFLNDEMSTGCTGRYQKGTYGS